FANTGEGEMFTEAMWDKMQTGLRNNITLGTNTNIARYFTFSLGANIDNALTTKTLRKTYNPITNTVEDNFNNKIGGYSVFSTNASLQTTLYGTKIFKAGSAIQGIRHMVMPSIGFSYRPRSEEHTSELQSRENLVCRLLLEK